MEPRDAQRAKGAGDGQQAGVEPRHLAQGTDVDFKKRLILSGDARKQEHSIAMLSILCRGKNASGMRFLAFAQNYVRIRALGVS